MPTEVAASVPARILDTIGIAAAATSLSTSQAVTALAVEQGGAPQSSAIGVSRRLPAPTAAFVNGVLAHSLDFDDTHLPSILHPSASVVPACLAAAERGDRDGKATIDAVAVGIEIVVRLGMAGYDRKLGNSSFFERGQHATSICGAIGSAAAAAMLLGADEASLADAMAIAVSSASGVIESNRTGGTVKRLHCGWAAERGVMAAELAVRGITGPPTALEGRFGFFQAWLDGDFAEHEITDGLGDSWVVPALHVKPYPANHFTHTAADAASRIRKRGVGPDNVESAVLRVAAPTVRTIGEPLSVKQRPETGYQAQFSGPYVVAASFFGGTGLGLGLDDFTDELARDPRRRALMAKIEVEAGPDLEQHYPAEFPAELTVVTTSGDTVVERVLTNLGGPRRPLSEEQLRVKFQDTAGRVMPPADVASVEAAVRNLAGLDDLADLTEPLTRIGGTDDEQR